MEEDYSQPTQPTQPEVPKPQEGISTVTGILITLLAAALIGAGIWYYYTYKILPDLEKSPTTAITPTKTDKTADWKTYTNTTFGYSFKYPKEYFVVDDCYNTQKKAREDYENDSWLVMVDKKDFGNNPACESDFPQTAIIVRASNTKVDLNEQKQGSTTDLEKEQTLAGENWLKLVLTEPSALDGSYSTVLHANYHNKGYTISLENSDKKGTHEKTIDQILDTFEFTK